MKKLLCVLLMIMMVSFTGCSPKESAEEIYQKAYEQALAHDNMTVIVDEIIKIDETVMGNPASMGMEFVTQYAGESQMYMSSTQSMNGQEQGIMEFWIKDNYVYYNFGDVKISEQKDPSVEYDAFNFLDLDGLIKSGKVEADGTNKVLTIEINEDGYLDMLHHLISQSGMDQMGIIIYDQDISMSDITVVVDKNNDLVSTKYQIDFNANVDGKDSRFSFEIDANYSDINETTIDFPDFNNYTNAESTGDNDSMDTDYSTNITGDEKVCHYVTDNGISESTIYFSTGYTGAVQSVKWIRVIDFSSLDEETQKSNVEEEDGKYLKAFNKEGVTTTSSFENGIYTITMTFTDISIWGKLVDDTNIDEFKNLDFNIKQLEDLGFTCE